MLRLLEGLDAPARGLIGPWAHNYPHQGVPGPAIDFHGEVLRWLDQWLRGRDTSVMDEPALRAWMPEWAAPGADLDERPGRWVAEDTWPSPRVARREHPLAGGGLGAAGPTGGDPRRPVGRPARRRRPARRPARRTQRGRPAPHLRTIADLARLGEISYGEYPDNITGPLGFDAIVKAYGLKRMKVRPLNIGLQYPALATGRVQAADVFTTDPQLRHHDFTILDDDKHVFGFQNVAPVVRQKIVEWYGARLTEPLDLVDALLTEPAMQALNEAVAIKRLSPTEVARRFLRANDLT